MDGVMNYPMYVTTFIYSSMETNTNLASRYYPLREAFKSSSGNMGDLYNMINSVSSNCRDPTLLGSFIENHDNARFARYASIKFLTLECVLLTKSPSYTKDISQAKNVLAFIFLTDGIPIVYAGQEQHYEGGEDPYNREPVWWSGYSTQSELYQFIAATNKVRKLAIDNDSGYVTSRVSPIPQLTGST